MESNTSKGNRVIMSYYIGIENESIANKQESYNSKCKTRKLTKAEKEKYSEYKGSGIKRKLMIPYKDKMLY